MLSCIESRPVTWASPLLFLHPEFNALPLSGRFSASLGLGLLKGQTPRAGEWSQKMGSPPPRPRPRPALIDLI